MGLFLLEHTARHKDGEVTILHSNLLDLSIKPGLNGLPNSVGPGTEDVAAADIVILDHLSLGDHLRVPVGQVFLLLGLKSKPRLLFETTFLVITLKSKIS